MNICLYTPQPYQKRVHDAISSLDGKQAVIVVVSKRQVGKSMMAINEVIRQAMRKNRTILYITPTLSQSRKVFRDISKALSPHNLLRKTNETLLEMETITSSTVLFRSSEQKDTLRGYTVDFVVLDEAAFLSEEIWGLVSPMTDVRRATTLIISTPRFSSGFFFNMYSLALRGENNCILFDWSKEDTSMFLSKERLEFYRSILPEIQFRNEYLGQFAEAQSVVFGDFKSCISPFSLASYNELYVGIDYGNGMKEDDTVVTALNEWGQQVFLEYWNDRTSIQSADCISSLLSSYADKNITIYAEQNSLGKPQIELLQQRNHTVTPKVTTNTSKAEMVAKLQNSFEQHDITLLDDRRQTNELASYSYEYNPQTGKVTYNAPQGLHDDICIALSYANLCRIEAAETGYSLSLLDYTVRRGSTGPKNKYRNKYK